MRIKGRDRGAVISGGKKRKPPTKTHRDDICPLLSVPVRRQQEAERKRKKGDTTG